jgi:hypothetical protein
MIRFLKHKFYFLFFLFYFIIARPASSFTIAEEYVLKASYIHNFLNFVSFPGINQKDSIEICIAGENPFGKTIHKLAERNIDGKIIIISEKKIDDGIKSCNVLFVPMNFNKDLPKILEIINHYPIFTITESPDSLDQGVVLNFYIENEKIRFEINVEAVKKSGLVIDPRLLNLAKLIKKKD